MGGHPGQHLADQMTDERHVRPYDVLATAVEDNSTAHGGLSSQYRPAGESGTEEKR
ncbi:hypothetical protein GCM10022629_23080 [Amorphoplanes auranticolor]